MSGPRVNAPVDGVAGVFEQFQSALQLEIRQRDERIRELQAELHKYKSENAELQAQLNARSAKDATNDKAQDNLSSDHVNDEPVPYATYAKLREQQEITWQSLKVSHQAIDRYKLKYQKIKDSIRPWQEYAKRCEERLAQRTNPAIPELDALLPPIRPSVDSSDLGSSRPSTAGRDSRTKSGSPAGLRFKDNVETRRDNSLVSKSPSKLRNSVHTRNEKAGISAIEQQTDETKAQACDETPISHIQGSFILPEDAFVKVEPEARSDASGSTEQPTQCSTDLPTSATTVPVQQREKPAQTIVHIKSEPDSSPVLPANNPELHRTETLDLDEIGSRIATPRKVQRMQALLRQGSSLSFPPPGMGSSSPILADMPKHPVLSATYRGDLIGSEMPRKTTLAPKRKHYLMADIESVAEDGKAVPRSFKPISPSKKLKANRAIEALLESTPAKRPLISPGASKTPQPMRQPLANISTPTAQNIRRGIAGKAQANKQLPTPQSDLQKRKIPAASDSDSNMTPPLARVPLNDRSPRKRATPLRQRRLEELTSEDFKLNPLAHGDLDLTTADAIRTRENRAHLYGCTSSNCIQCGDAMRALASELPITVGSSLFASSQDERLTNEERLLKHHLGDSFNQAQIARMNPAEREELVMQAKIKIVAERSGRHRLRPNARARSPPGFWDVEMPTTQDLEERRKEVERRERDVVRERYREAMRHGGRWMFKDE